VRPRAGAAVTTHRPWEKGFEDIGGAGDEEGGGWRDRHGVWLGGGARAAPGGATLTFQK